MGYWPIGILESALCLILTAILFAAPLYETLLIEGVWEDWRGLGPIIRIWTQLTTWRNIVMVSCIKEAPDVSFAPFIGMLIRSQGTFD